MSRCRSCKAPVRWATSENGKPIPLDPDPRPDGNIELHELNGRDIARVLTDRRRQELEQQILAANRAGDTLPLNLYLTHFSSCPSAAEHRQRTTPSEAENKKLGRKETR